MCERMDQKHKNLAQLCIEGGLNLEGKNNWKICYAIKLQFVMHFTMHSIRTQKAARLILFILSLEKPEITSRPSAQTMRVRCWHLGETNQGGASDGQPLRWLCNGTRCKDY